MSKLKPNLTYAEFQEAIIACLMSCNSFETDEDIFNRGLAFKRFIKEYLIKNPLPNGEKLAIVCHSKFICALTASHVTGEGDSSKMQNY